MLEHEELIRFTALLRDQESHAAAGLFAVAYDLMRSDLLPDYDCSRLQDDLTWFEKNLTVPKRLLDPETTKAISWFRPGATEHIRRARSIESILRDHGISTQVLRTDRPGRIVYEDEIQVVSIPDRDNRGSLRGL